MQENRQKRFFRRMAGWSKIMKLVNDQISKRSMVESMAMFPLPKNRIANVSATTTALQWKPGQYVVKQILYYSGDKAAVESGKAHAILSSDMSPSTDHFDLPAKLIEPGKTYFWRVEQDNGKIPAARGDTWAFRTADVPTADEVTFFVGSDTHYGLGNNASINRKVIDEMNWLPGENYPQVVRGGTVRTPSGLVLDGDLLDKGFEAKTAVPAWAEFTADYGLQGHDGRLAYPLYEGFGNHDGMTGKSISREGIRMRNKDRKNLAAVSENRFHYSWDWNHVHLAQLNLFPGKDSADCIVGPPNHHPEGSLGFLKDDLARNVKDRNKIVIIFCHYCYTGGMADWWTDAAKDRFYDVIKGYRVILIHGHSHGAYFYKWKGIPVISDGSTARPDSQAGDFLVVRLTQSELIVAQRKLGEWGITERLALPVLSAPQK